MEICYAEVLGNMSWSYSLLLIYEFHSKEYYSGVLLLVLPSLAPNSHKILRTPDDRRHNWHIYMGIDSHLLTTFPAHFTPSTIILMVAIFLAFETLQWVGYVLLDPLHCITNFYFFSYFVGVKLHYICIRLYCFLLFSFFNRYSFHFSHTLLFFNSLFISSMVHKESSLLLTTPLLTFRDLWGYVLTLILWNFVILSRKSACFLFSTSTSRVWFFKFFYGHSR